MRKRVLYEMLFPTRYNSHIEPNYSDFDGKQKRGSNFSRVEVRRCGRSG